MNFGFDLDHTLAKPLIPFWQIAGENIGIHGIVEPPRFWGFPEYPKHLAEECHRLFHMNWFMNGLLHSDPMARQLLLSLGKEGHNIYIVTARYREVREGTLDFVLQNFYPFIKDVIFVEPGVDKAEVLESIRADVWIDDKPEDCWQSSQRQIKTFVINQPWNMQMVEGKGFSLFKCRDLTDVATKLKSWMKLV